MAGLQSAESPRRAACWLTLKLVYIDDMDQTSAANTLGVSVATLKRYNQQAIALLSRHFLPSLD